MADSWMLHPSQGFIRLGGHQLVQAGVAGEAVLEGDDVPGAADEAAARRHIGDVPQLGVGDVQESRQLITVCGGLIQQDEEFAVRQHEAGCIGTEKFLHILRQPCHKAVSCTLLRQSRMEWRRQWSKYNKEHLTGPMLTRQSIP